MKVGLNVKINVEAYKRYVKEDRRQEIRFVDFYKVERLDVDIRHRDLAILSEGESTKNVGYEICFIKVTNVLLRVVVSSVNNEAVALKNITDGHCVLEENCFCQG